MLLLTVSVVVAVTVVTCFKAYHNTKLLEKDPEAWSRLQAVEDEKRRRREAMIGNVMVAGWQLLCGKKE
jgi:hypothetical protein